MGTYVTSVTDHVQPRCSKWPISATSKPTATQVDTWVTEAESEVLGVLGAAGIPEPAVGSTGGNQIRAWVGKHVANLFVAAQLANEDRQASLEAQEAEEMRWDRLHDRILAAPAVYSERLGGGSAASNTIRVASHLTDSSLGIDEDEDLGPMITVKGGAGNF